MREHLKEIGLLQTKCWPLNLLYLFVSTANNGEEHQLAKILAGQESSHTSGNMATSLAIPRFSELG